jgi:uncharacterized protein
MSEEVRISARDGLSLEGSIDSPDVPKGVVVLCHPHPQMGGTMRAPLLEALVEELSRRDWAAVRFNFRGIGTSEGVTGTGEAEVADALGAVDQAKERFGSLPLALAGWSFGAAVALHVAGRVDELAACVAIAPAVEAKPGITEGAPAPDAYSSRAPTLIVVGANDDLVSPASCRRWAEEAGARFVEMPGANHFFWARYEPLAKTIGDFLDDRHSEVTT